MDVKKRPNIVDPYVSLRSFQRALRCGSIRPISAKLYPELLEYADNEPFGGAPRMTFALAERGTVKAIVIFGEPIRPAEHVLHIQVGYAVAKAYRNQGLARSMLSKCIEEFRNRARGDVDVLHVKAIVSHANVASQKVAAHVLSSRPRMMTDERSGEPALEYIGSFETSGSV